MEIGGSPVGVCYLDKPGWGIPGLPGRFIQNISVNTDPFCTTNCLQRLIFGKFLLIGAHGVPAEAFGTF
jgi:hypothetical protein